YDVQSLYRIGIFSSVALHTAALFLVLSAGVFCARPAPTAWLIGLRFGLVAQVVTVVELVVVLARGPARFGGRSLTQTTLREKIFREQPAAVHVPAPAAHRGDEGGHVT